MIWFDIYLGAGVAMAIFLLIMHLKDDIFPDAGEAALAMLMSLVLWPFALFMIINFAIKDYLSTHKNPLRIFRFFKRFKRSKVNKDWLEAKLLEFDNK